MKHHDSGKENIRSSLAECSLLTLLVVLVWSITCAGKGIWPFGRMLLDIGDMSGQCVPMYTHLWDVLHGQKAFLFDWYTGLGNNMAGPDLHFGVISPFNLFFLFIKRSAIEYAMSVYILIKLIAIGFCMRFVLKKWFPHLSGWMNLSFSLLYVFSAFNMQYYYATMWLDLAFMFPLVMYGYFLLMNDKKGVFYIVCLTLACMMSFQHTFMLFIMLLFLTGFLPLLSREKYQKNLLRLLGATLIALMIAAWILLPATIQILTSSRKDLNYSFSEIWNSIWLFFTAKWIKLLNMGIPLSFFLLYAVKNYKEKAAKFFGYVLFIICAPVCLESTNILWHGGLYQGYTMRFSYMLTFWVLAAGAYAYEKYAAGEQGRELIEEKRTHHIIGALSLVLLLVITGAQYFILKSDMTTPYKESIPAVVIMAVIGASIVGGCGSAFYARKKGYEKILLAIVILQSFTLAQTMILVFDKPENNLFTMCSEAVDDSRSENKNLTETNPTVRIKFLDVTTDNNYPLIMQKNAASCYMNVNGIKQMDGIVKLGYVRMGYRISDYGGTLFSDALLGVEEVISGKDVNDSLYRYQNTYQNYSIYQCLYGYGQGIRLKNFGPEKESDDQEENPFLYQNRIAKELVGSELMDVTASDGREMSLHIDEKSILYLYADTKGQLESIKITDRNTKEEYTFPMDQSGWTNGIIELGTWEDALLSVQIDAKEPTGEVFCAVLPLQKFMDHEPEYFENYTISRKRNTLSISLDKAEEGDYLFLPVYHDAGWKCSVNGKKTQIEDFAHFLMAIPIQEGENEIKLSYAPVGFHPGMLLSILGVVLFIIFCRYPVKKEYEKLNLILWTADELLFAVLMLLFYIIPIIFLLKGTVGMLLG